MKESPSSRYRIRRGKSKEEEEEEERGDKMKNRHSNKAINLASSDSLAELINIDLQDRTDESPSFRSRAGCPFLCGNIQN